MAIKSKIIIDAQDKTRAAFSGVSRGLAGVSGKVSLVVGAVAGLAGVAGFGALVAQSFKTQDALAKTSDKLGTATEKLGGLRHAAEITGVANATLDKGLQNMIRNIADFSHGTGEAKKELELLGFTQGQLAAMSPDQQFAAISEAMKGVESNTERVNIAYKIFGGRATELLNTMALGKDGLAAYQQEAEKLGIALNRVDAAKIEQANDATTRLKGLVQGAGNSFAVELAPFITAVTTEMKDMALEAGGFKQIAIDSIDGLVTGIGFAIDAVHGLGVAWDGINTLFAGVASFILNGLDDLQKGVVDLANTLPGVDIEPIQALSDTAASADARFQELEAQLAATVMQPMPSENFKKWAEDVKASANEAAQAVAAASPANQASMQSADATGGLTEDPEIKKMQDRLAKLDESLMSERELLTAHYEEKQFLVEDAFQNELISQSERDATLQKLAADHESKLSKIQNKGLSDRQKFQQMTTIQQTKFVLGELGTLLQGVAGHNKTLFKINKIAAIANAIVSTSEGVAKSLAAYPYPINIGMAAASFAAGIAQVNAIRSQEFGGGGSVPSPSGGAAGGSASSGQAAVQQALATQDGVTQAVNTTSTETPAAAPQQTVTLALSENDDELISVSAMRKFLERAEKVRADMGPNARLVIA